MGAWGSGNFENDAVMDWVAELADWSSVRSALNNVLHAPDDAYVDADACCVALGAAEIVAACLGRPAQKLPERARAWAAANRNQCDEQTRELAVACTRKIEAGSELQELFDEGERDEPWHAELQALLERLAS